jgi:hypothetical protein
MTINPSIWAIVNIPQSHSQCRIIERQASGLPIKRLRKFLQIGKAAGQAAIVHGLGIGFAQELDIFNGAPKDGLSMK